MSFSIRSSPGNVFAVNLLGDLIENGSRQVRRTVQPENFMDQHPLPREFGQTSKTRRASCPKLALQDEALVEWLCQPRRSFRWYRFFRLQTACAQCYAVWSLIVLDVIRTTSSVLLTEQGNLSRQAQNVV